MTMTPLSRRRVMICAAAAMPGAALAQVAPKPIPSASLDRFAAYRRLYAAADDRPVLWWFSGVMAFAIDGVREITALAMESVRICQVRADEADGYTIAWKEIGCFRDLITGEVAGPWLNPFTRAASRASPPFAWGSGGYTVRRRADGVAIEADRADVALSAEGMNGRLILTQVERRKQGYGGVGDGNIGVTSVYAVVADQAGATEAGGGLTPASGLYSHTFDGNPPWAGFPDRLGFTLIRGAMRKSAAGERLNPRAWAALKAARPQDFSGDALRLS